MKKNIAVVSGGYSGEFSISIQSGAVVKKHLDQSKYRTFPILVKPGSWTYTDEKGNILSVDKNDFSLQLSSEKIIFDAVFIAIHGTPGEDGKIQGYFDMLNIPYTSCDLTTSAITFNKHFCKQIVSSLNVKTARSIFLTKALITSTEDILKQLQLPLFIKPNNGGSSVGMSKISLVNELGPALEKAFAEDDQVLVEEFIKGREITCGVFQAKNKITALPVTEIISKKEWFDFEAKYNPELAEEVVPANIPEDVYKKCQSISGHLYSQLNCKGVVRFDYIYNDNGIYFLEVNTVPGLTEASIVPKMAKCQGMELSKLFSMLVEEAME